jgi:SAM-dependent methyltransferase
MSVYEFKAEPSSSHSLILNAVPASGDGAALLDVGCASGYLASLMAERGFVVTGIDAPGVNRSRFPSTVRLIEADLHHGLPPVEGKFAWIICADVLEHLKEPDRALADMKALLVPGGKLVLSIPNSGHAWFRLSMALGRKADDDRGLLDRTHLHFWEWPAMEELVRRGGFRILERKMSGTPVGLAVPFLSWLDSTAYWMAQIWPLLFAYQFILIAEPGD